MSTGNITSVQPGKLTALLKNVLVTGFGLLAVDSLAYDGSSGEVTATINSGHNYKKDSILLIEGANEDAYNGEQRITFVSVTQFRYAPSSAPSATVETGIVSAKVAPVGWEVVAESPSGEVMIFGPTDPNSGPIKLLVNNTINQGDNWSAYDERTLAGVSMVEDVVSIDSYTVVATGFWPASHAFGLGCWQVVADPRLMYLSVNYGANKRNSILPFGEL
ncbi:MAG: hypothetical protein WBH20_14695, partial [Oceanisphaera sp.]